MIVYKTGRDDIDTYDLIIYGQLTGNNLEYTVFATITIYVFEKERFVMPYFIGEFEDQRVVVGNELRYSPSYQMGIGSYENFTTNITITPNNTLFEYNP